MSRTADTVEPGEAFDPVGFKTDQREGFEASASGWRKWLPVIEGPECGGAVNQKLLELARLRPGDVVLDVAAGYGEPGLTVARAVSPGGRVVCTDIAPGMLAHGRERAREAGLDNVEFLERDAEQLDFPPETFDAIVSRWGLMFLPDVPGTLRHLHSFLKPGGRLAVVTWGPPPSVQWSGAMPVILGELQLPPPPPGPGIFALSDPVALAGMLANAGFEGVESGTLQAVVETDSPEDLTQLIRDISAPIAALVNERPPEVQERVWAKVTEGWAPFVTAEGRARTENQAVWVAGTKEM